VASEAGLAVGARVAGNEAVNPAQFAAAALGVAGGAILDRAVNARERPRHQELRVAGEKEGRDQTNDSRESQRRRQTVAPEVRIRLLLDLQRPNRFRSRRSPHHHAPDENA
jgi:hypothetical protein